MSAEAPGRPSIKDVAARAGVSVGTVSNVLNRPHVVAGPTRERVQAAVVELGFVRNESARQLRSGASRVLAYVLLDAGNPFFTDVAEGMEVVAEQEGLALFLCDSRNDPARQARYLARLREQRVQGVLLTPVEAAVQDRAEATGPPVVLVDRTGDGRSCSVGVDDRLGGRLAVGHLVALGHRAVAFAGEPDGPSQVRDRWTGVRTGWQEAGLVAQDLRLLPTQGLGLDAGRAAGTALLALPAGHRPSGVVCANDLVALGLLQQVLKAGLSVPGDLAVVGYDDIAFAAAAAVPLTSVRQPRYELGVRAARLVLAEAADPDHLHESAVLVPELVVRASTAG